MEPYDHSGSHQSIVEPILIFVAGFLKDWPEPRKANRNTKDHNLDRGSHPGSGGRSLVPLWVIQIFYLANKSRVF